MKNIEIRLLLDKNHIKHFELAKELNISDTTLSRWLREELSREKRVQIIKTINNIVSNREETRYGNKVQESKYEY